MGKTIDVEEIYPFVENAQDIYTQELLGSALYNDLCYKIYTNVTLSPEENELVDMCSKSLVYWTVYLALPHLYLRIRNSGVVKTQSGYTINTDLNELKYLKEEMSNLAEFWSQRTINYLCKNHSKFTLYNKSDDIQPTDTQYDSDIYIGDVSESIREEIKYIKKYLR